MDVVELEWDVQGGYSRAGVAIASPLAVSEYVRVDVVVGRASRSLRCVRVDPLGVEHEVPRCNDRFSHDTDFAVGRHRLRIAGGEQQAELELDVLADPNKLDGEAYLAMLEEIERWSGAATLGRGLHGLPDAVLASEGATAGILVAVALRLLDLLARALRVVGMQARKSLLEEERAIPLHRVRSVDTELLRWFMRRPEGRGGRAAGDDTAQDGEATHLRVPRRSVFETADHPVNRHLRWLLARLDARLGSIATALRKSSKELLEQRWAEQIERGRHRLRRIIERGFLAELRPEPRPETVVILLGDPVYHRVHRVLRIMLNPRFCVRKGADEGGAVPGRASFDLYELWCFTRVETLISARLASPRWQVQLDLRGREGDVFGGVGWGSSITWTSDAGVLSLHFNRTFFALTPTRLARMRGCLSSSGEQRPDVVLCWSPRKRPLRWLILDAKYRAGRRNLTDAFESAHVYRDALRWDDRACALALLLTPHRDAAMALQYEPDHHAKFGTGLVELRPGQPSTLGVELLAWLGVATT